MLVYVGKSITFDFYDTKSVDQMTITEASITDQQTSENIRQTFSREDIRHFIIDNLADINCTDASTLEQEATQGGGDLDMDSEAGAAIAHKLEGIVGRDLVRARDLKPDNFKSVNRLTDLLYRNSQQPPRRTPHKSPKRRPT